MDRRHFLKSCGAVPLLPVLRGDAKRTPGLVADSEASFTLGYNTYGTRALSTEEAIDAIAKTGYDTIELAFMPQWDIDPTTLSTGRKRDLKKRLADSGLRLSVLMEHLTQTAIPESDPTVALERLRRLLDLAHLFGDAQTPLIETALGGKLGWNKARELLLTRLPAWQALAEKEKVVIAIKPHRSMSMSRPEHAIELIGELGDSPFLRLNFDYSHYAFRDPPLPLVETIERSASHVGLVTVKDTYLNDEGKPRFELPGATDNIDYVKLLKTLQAAGYRGDIQCEVSVHLWGHPNFDPIAAMKTCYSKMATAFDNAGIRRA